MRRTLFAIAAAGILPLYPASISAAFAQRVEIGELRQNFERCHGIASSETRLSCYDELVRKLVPPTYQGSLAEEIAPFVIDRPTFIRYQSDGPVFVMYLKDARGEVVQNLHIGGGGEASFLITKPGRYGLQVSGTDTWRIWVEPQGPAPFVQPRG